MLSKEKFLKFKSEFQIEHILNFVVAFIIAIILIIACVSMYRPIDRVQFQQVKRLAQQEVYPKTQAMADQLIHQEVIRSSDYYRLMYAKHYESSKLRIYPAASVD